VFQLVQHHKYSLEEIENMYPFEYDIFTSLIEKMIKEREAETA
jgi:hypothetical protein